MYETKIPYDFTIRVYFAFSVLCQKYVFDNFAIEHPSQPLFETWHFIS